MNERAVPMRIPESGAMVMSTSLPDAQVAAYRERGIVHPLRALPAAEADALHGRYQEHAVLIRGRNNQKPHLLYTWLDALVRDPRIVDAVESLLGPNLLCWGSQFFAKPAGDAAYVSWHQDATYWGLSSPDVVTAWAGIRPLIASGNAGNPAQASREDEIVTGPGGVISVSGGKLTTYRAMAEHIVNVIQKHLGLAVTPSQTSVRPLAAPQNDFACKVADVLVRRSKIAFNSRDHGLAEAPRVAADLAVLHGWNANDIVRAREDYRAEIARLFTIEP